MIWINMQCFPMVIVEKITNLKKKTTRWGLLIFYFNEHVLPSIITLPRLRSHPEVTSDQIMFKAHGVRQTKNTGSGNRFERKNSMIRGHFLSGDGLIRGHIRMVII